MRSSIVVSFPHRLPVTDSQPVNLFKFFSFPFVSAVVWHSHKVTPTNMFVCGTDRKYLSKNICT
jgi:hypothetical protein